MPNMNSSKRARQQDSIKNLPTCGGNKKSGLRRFIGMDTSLSLGRFGSTPEQQPGLPCTGTLYTTIRNQTCAGGVGRQVNMRHCGEGAPKCGEENGGDDRLPVTVGGTGIITDGGEGDPLSNLNPTFWRSPGTIMKTFSTDSNITNLSLNMKEQTVGTSVDVLNSTDLSGFAYYYSTLNGKPKRLDDDGANVAIAHGINNNGVILGCSMKDSSVSYLLWRSSDEKPLKITLNDSVDLLFPKSFVGTTRLNDKEEFLVDAVTKKDGIDVNFSFFTNQRAKAELKQVIDGKTYTDCTALGIGENNNAVGRIGKKMVDGVIEANEIYQPAMWTKIDLTSGSNELTLLSTNVDGKEMTCGEILSINKNNQMIGRLYNLGSDSESVFGVYENPNSPPVALPKPLISTDSTAIPLTAKIGDSGDIICSYRVETIIVDGESSPYDVMGESSDVTVEIINVKSFYHKDINSIGEEFCSPNSNDNAVLALDFLPISN